MEFTALSAFRKQYGVKQVEMARAAKVSLTAYQNWERGTSAPNNENYIRILDFMQSKIEESVKGEIRK